MAQTRMAFALAGLGGFNAHGAGFLTAAREAQARPDLITATSGQIVVLAGYLSGAADLRAGLIDPAIEADPLAQLKIALFGYQGVFEPAYADTIARILMPPWLGFGIDFFADRFLPAELYKPTRTDDTIDGIVAALNGKTHLASLFPDGNQVGVVFNSYNPSTGMGRLYGNDQARALLRGRTRLPVQETQRSADPKLEESDDEIWPIDREAVKSALWLSLYGFNGIPNGEMDGAYHRSCIVSNLHDFDNVVVCRPLANGYSKGQLPQNYFDVQDWNTEMWFSVGYKAEVDAMKRINSLIQDGKLKHDSGMRFVGIHEIEPETPAGYFNYFIERESVFDDAKLKAARLFKNLVNGKLPPPPAFSEE